MKDISDLAPLAIPHSKFVSGHQYEDVCKKNGIAWVQLNDSLADWPRERCGLFVNDIPHFVVKALTGWSLNLRIKQDRKEPNHLVLPSGRRLFGVTGAKQRLIINRTRLSIADPNDWFFLARIDMDYEVEVGIIGLVGKIRLQDARERAEGQTMPNDSGAWWAPEPRGGNPCIMVAPGAMKPVIS